MNKRLRIADWLLLIAVPAFFFLWKLSSFGLIGADEPRYAQIAREMLARHDWITPTLSGIPWLEKPPLYYWQAMVAYALFGVSDWSARLPSVLDAWLLVLAVYWFMQRIRQGSELDSALVTATMAGIVGFARAASTDMPLAATFTIAMFAWYAWVETGITRYLAVSYLFIGLATLAKGPVAPLLAIAIIVLLAALQRSFQIVWKTFWIPGLLLFSATTLPWYVFVQIRNPQFFHEFIIEHNLARFGTNIYHHTAPFWYYVPVTLLGWMPWSLAIVIALILAIRQVRRHNINALQRFLIIWIAIVVIFFSISQSKLPGYVLPALPAGAILTAEFIREDATGKNIAGFPRTIVAVLQALLIAILLFGALNIQTLILWHRISWNAAVIPLVIAAAAGAGIFLLLVKSNLQVFRITTLAPTILILAIALRLGARLLDDKLSARPVAVELNSLNAHHLPVAVFLIPRETQFGLEFYLNQVIPRYELRQVPAGEHLLVAAEGYPKGVAKVAGSKITYLGRFAPQRLEVFYVAAR
ncbi:MAG TPA: glycosyltransferase family 39 protein [Terriglobales bacterium]